MVLVAAVAQETRELLAMSVRVVSAEELLEKKNFITGSILARGIFARSLFASCMFAGNPIGEFF